MCQMSCIKPKKKNPFVLAFTISAMSISETPLSGDSKLNVSKDNLKKWQSPFETIINAQKMQITCTIELNYGVKNILKGVEYLPRVPILRSATLFCWVCCSTAREALVRHLEEKGEVLEDGKGSAELRREREGLEGGEGRVVNAEE